MKTKEEKKKELDAYSMISQLLNELVDDLTLDLGKGENGYKSYEDSYKAVKKHTLKKIMTMSNRLRRKVRNEPN